MKEKNELSKMLYLGIAAYLGTLFQKIIMSLDKSSLTIWVIKLLCIVGVLVFLCYFAYILFCSPEIYLKSQCERKPCEAVSCFVYVEKVGRCLDVNGFEKNLEFIEKHGGN